jgi:hypothetical protein
MMIVFMAEGCNDQTVQNAEEEGETEDIMKKAVIFYYIVFCMSLCSFMYGAMTASILCLNIRTVSSGFRLTGVNGLSQLPS